VAIKVGTYAIDAIVTVLPTQNAVQPARTDAGPRPGTYVIHAILKVTPRGTASLGIAGSAIPTSPPA
jgi:hypothetical protein